MSRFDDDDDDDDDDDEERCVFKVDLCLCHRLFSQN